MTPQSSPIPAANSCLRNYINSDIQQIPAVCENQICNLML
jgi:hypothetical protein